MATSTIIADTAPRQFYDDQPDPVRAVLDLASLDLDDSIRDRILATFAPEHADTIANIAADLEWIERLRCETPCQVLSAYHDAPVHGLYLDQAADRLADELTVGVVTQAQFVASLIVGAK